MRPEFLRTLQSRSGAIQASWERLLRLESISSPLAHPDALVHLIPTTLIFIFAAVAKAPGRALTLREARAVRWPYCPCARNPYLAYFTAGEQALLEAMVLLQAERPAEERHLAELAELVHVVREVGHAEIENFCGVCVLKSAPGRREAAAAASPLSA